MSGTANISIRKKKKKIVSCTQSSSQIMNNQTTPLDSGCLIDLLPNYMSVPETEEVLANLLRTENKRPSNLTK
jgi:hypothetical protein